jgi:predicted nucleic acid-binding protein
MAWVVDTSILLDVHLADHAFGRSSARCLARHLSHGLVICPVTYVELSPAFDADEELEQAFLHQAGVNWLEPWTWQDTKTSHRLWAEHIERKRTKHAAKRPIADILIESFSQRFEGLITRDPKHFSSVPVVCP